MSRSISLAIIATPFCLMSCHYDDDRLKVINRKTHSICLETAPDTLLQYGALGNGASFLTNKVLPGDSTILHYMNEGGWPSGIQNNKNHKFNLFVYHGDSVRKYDYNFDALEGKELERIPLSLEEMEARNWHIIIK